MVNMSIANIITRIITGVTYDWEDKAFQDIVACSGKLFDISGPAGLFSLNPVFARLPLPVNFEIRRLCRTIMDFIQVSIDEHRKNFDPNAPVKDFIGSYLKEMASADAVSIHHDTMACDSRCTPRVILNPLILIPALIKSV